ncbi:hypothetical protein K9N68_22260 [Kovacikia minuta CCNUW1]|uniref:hypothetical protein n=1 Tax=Kovacikia minuta TaxID=2931930 RepID=UPI001CC9F000|nr:hypothetical protein [Kovacikia minuta]UBF24409.1 hypothetical protein K9N68_22260 [Kovacikia minuta CCNUW1]
MQLINFDQQHSPASEPANEPWQLTLTFEEAQVESNYDSANLLAFLLQLYGATTITCH